MRPRSLIAGKQERSSGRVTPDSRPDLEMVGRFTQQGGALAGMDPLRTLRRDSPPKRYAQSFVRLVEAACCGGLIARFWHLRPARVPRDGLARGLTSGPAATARPSADARTIEPIGRSRSASCWNWSTRSCRRTTRPG